MIHCLAIATITYTALDLWRMSLQTEYTLEAMDRRKVQLEVEMKALVDERDARPRRGSGSWWTFWR